MTSSPQLRELRMIPMERIDVLNPRERNQGIFSEIIANIDSIGLKKPITVTPRPGDDGAERFLLICGEGRLKAFSALGETRIPALVVVASDEDAFLMSLTENIARRKYRALELLSGIGLLKDKGYGAPEIARKIGLSSSYVRDLLTLIEHGEERLLVAVQNEQIPLNAALCILAAGDDDKSIQQALQNAYESGSLRGRQLMEARRLIQKRQQLGRSVSRGMSRKKADVTTSSLVREYQKEVQRQQIMVRRASASQERLLFIAGALRRLIADDNFTNLLRAEGLDTIPKYLAERIIQMRA